MIIGSDLLPYIKTWDEGEKLMNNLNFLIYPREGYPLLPKKHMPRNYTIADNKDIINRISSTEARRLFVNYMNNMNRG
jgi:nicotinic acid mononucleotide adenylyltransferase